MPKHHLHDSFRPSQSAYYVLLGRRDTSDASHERVVFVHYLDRFLDSCERQIEDLWQRHRVLITHVAVKLGRSLRRSPSALAQTYARALEVQQLRQQLHPRFRRL